MIHIIGAGLAGSEAAYQLAKQNIDVRLYEMKPEKYSPAHKLKGPAELVCSNSLGSMAQATAGGLLKSELQLLDSIILKAADIAKVPAGNALAVDREKMSDAVYDILSGFPNVSWEIGEVTRLPEGETIIATGPLTSDAFAEIITELAGRRLSFFDATSPIVDADTIDMNKVYAASRYDKGEPDYLNCPMSKDQYDAFIAAVKNADLITPRDFEDINVFEGCMPIEQIVARGDLTLAYGALKPVGLPDPKTGEIPYAVVQLRKEDVAGHAYNLVGFQTRMNWPSQQRVFKMIPGLENAEFLRLGVMHRNTYIEGPKILDSRLRLKNNSSIAFAGQITGVEGYVESTAMGMLASLFTAYPDMTPPPGETMLGALYSYITGYEGKSYQPMAANFGLLPPLDKKVKKLIRKQMYYERAMEALSNWAQGNSLIGDPVK